MRQKKNSICQVAADNGLDGILTMIATPSLFFNECEVHFQFNWKSLAELPGDVIVQVAMQDSRILFAVQYLVEMFLASQDAIEVMLVI